MNTKIQINDVIPLSEKEIKNLGIIDINFKIDKYISSYSSCITFSVSILNTK